MLLNRERLTLLTLLSLMAIGLSAFLVWRAYDTHTNSFIAGAPPKDIQDVIVPQNLDVTKLKPPAIRATDFVRYGSNTSSISVIEYGDYECEDCKAVAKTIKEVVEPYRGKVRFVFHHLPIEDRHPNAMDAAVFATCAGQQGSFWEAHDELMQTASLNASVYQSIAKKLRLDQTALTACRNDQEVAQQIRNNVEIAKGDGINGVPLIFVGTRAAYGEMTKQELSQEIERYLSP